MSEDIVIDLQPGQKSLKLLTAGKYCDSNIIINFPYTIITPKIGFAQAQMYAPNNLETYFTIVSSSDYSITFTFKGVSGCEELLFPINNLSPGGTYTISFSETYNGDFIADQYAFGCGIIQQAEYEAAKWPSGKGTPDWVQWDATIPGTQSGSLTFTANTDTVYWAWALSDIQDTVLSTISINVNIYVAS